ncbi:SDR family oxidoreductase [Bordetella genomosp. 9]|uniref:NADP-dependent 3-hydroxy acid dehydrogenase YdfG n=1 Tax=Bordetella genomosp. 9 TaxID=1416803 RepID=A0A261RPL3_9BORD|nr:SDR family oxidoreductase [Bordetella genomosp. 9]OZI26851.1 SDR family oxidoreductase [Bordetella genomosp. 9]
MNATTSHTASRQRTALVTGASSGIGAIYADRLARRGYDLILAARGEQRLRELADRLQAAHGRKAAVLVADLGQRDGQRRVEALLRDDASIDVLVNNAGFGLVAPFLQADLDRMEAMIDLNVTALTRLAHAAAAAFLARGKGDVINISSIAAINTDVLNGVYSGTKAYVLALSQAMQYELRDKGVRVQAVLPGPTATEFWGVAGMDHAKLPEGWVMSAEDMVDASLAGLDQGEAVTIPSLQDGEDWLRYDAQRQELAQRLAVGKPGPRYGVGR